MNVSTLMNLAVAYGLLTLNPGTLDPETLNHTLACNSSMASGCSPQLQTQEETHTVTQCIALRCQHA